jgi:Protein of unknown function (DUF3631)
MQRKTKNDKVERLGRRDNDDHVNFRRQCLRWARDNRQALSAITPKAPTGLNDRAFDAWEPLLAIAEHVGGDWPKLAREAAIALSGGEAANEERSVELLADIKVIFEADGGGELTTKALVAALCTDVERPWATWNKGKPISDRQIAKLLKLFSIMSEDVYPPGERHAKGYKRARFLEAFERYLAPANHASQEVGGSQACERVNADEIGTSRDFSIRVEGGLHGCGKCEKPANAGGLHAHTDKNPQSDDEATSDHREGAREGAHGGKRHGSAGDDDLTIPAFLDRRQKVCAQCGAGRSDDPPTAAVTAKNGGTVYVHERGCLKFWKRDHGNGACP